MRSWNETRKVIWPKLGEIDSICMWSVTLYAKGVAYESAVVCLHAPESHDHAHFSEFISVRLYSHLYTRGSLTLSTLAATYLFEIYRVHFSFG